MRCGTTLLALALSAPVMASDWSALHGTWQGSGTVRGLAATVELEFRPLLEGRAHALSFRNRMRDAAGGEWHFQAEAVYLCEAAAGPCRGHWYDSRGVILPLQTRFEAGALQVEWGDAATERGRTRYQPVSDGALDIRDEVLGADGAWRVFGTTSARRAPQ